MAAESDGGPGWTWKHRTPPRSTQPSVLTHSGRRPSQGQGFSTRVLGDTMQEMEKIKRQHVSYSSFVATELPSKRWQIRAEPNIRAAVPRHSKVDGSVQKCPPGGQTTLAKYRWPEQMGSNPKRLQTRVQERDHLSWVRGTHQFWGKTPTIGEKEREGSSGLGSRPRQRWRPWAPSLAPSRLGTAGATGTAHLPRNALCPAEAEPRKHVTDRQKSRLPLHTRVSSDPS